MPLTVGVPEIVPVESMVRPAGRPVAEKVYPPPVPPLATMVTGVIATPCTAVIETQLAVGSGAIVMLQLLVAVPAWLWVESVT